MTNFARKNTKQAKLTLVEVDEMRRLYREDGWTQAALSRRFGIGVQQVGRIVRGECWQTPSAEIKPRLSVEESLAHVRALVGNGIATAPKTTGQWYDGLTDEEMREATKLVEYGVDVWKARETILEGRGYKGNSESNS